MTATAKPAALFTVWNTGRQYTENGQRMAARIVGDVILFADIDRGIAGKLTNALPVELIRSESDLKREVMEQYDICAYSWHGFDFDDEMEELKAAALAQQVPSAPKAAAETEPQRATKTGLSIEDILPQYKLDRLSHDHSEELYAKEEQHLLIHLNGFYTLSEIDKKRALLKEAQREVFGY